MNGCFLDVQKFVSKGTGKGLTQNQQQLGQKREIARDSFAFTRTSLHARL
jgi:hypothetical protein